jgi:[ribosomal protein S5]-alanine N-acetyltransferase
MINLETERLIIRDHILSDLDSHHKLISNEKNMYYLDDIKTHDVQESRKNLQSTMDDMDNPNRKNYFLRIESKNKEHIGEIGYYVTDFTPVGKMVHLGYFINSQYWGHGYTTKALKEIMRFAFIENDVFRITTGCFKENIGSEKVMLKGGMTKEGEYKFCQ